MARNLCPDRARATLAVGAALLALAVPSAAGQVGAIVIGGLIGWRLFAAEGNRPVGTLGFGLPRSLAVGSLVAFAVLLLGLQAAAANGPHLLQLFNAFYRSGSLVFGGGHVVLPLLAARGRAAGMGGRGRVPGGLRRRPGDAGSAVHLCRLFGRGDGAGAQRLGRWADLPRGDLPAVFPAAGRDPAVLGRPAAAQFRAGRLARRECGRGRNPARGAVRPGLDERDRRAGRFRSGFGRVPRPRAMARAAMAGRRLGRGHGRGAFSSPPARAFGNLSEAPSETLAVVSDRSTPERVVVLVPAWRTMRRGAVEPWSRGFGAGFCDEISAAARVHCADRLGPFRGTHRHRPVTDAQLSARRGLAGGLWTIQEPNSYWGRTAPATTPRRRRARLGSPMPWRSVPSGTAFLRPTGPAESRIPTRPSFTTMSD